MEKYAVINYSSIGKIKRETKNVIVLTNGVKYAKGHTTLIGYLNLFEYLVAKYSEIIYNKIINNSYSRLEI